MAELERAVYEVEVHENAVQVLLSVHKECGPPVDWHALASADPPPEPVRQNTAEEAARKAEVGYRAGLLDRALKRVDVKRARLSQEVERARQLDDATFRKMVDSFRREHQEWQDSRDLAMRVLALEPQALVEAIHKLDPFSDISELGTDIRFAANEPTILEATIHVHSDSVVPKEVKGLLQSGRLSVKQMPRGKVTELFQDYVYGCVLRVANELFSALPIDTVIVTATDTLLNTATGHLEETPILSAAIPRRTLSRMNLEHIDPSDSMSNFVHRMKFKKIKGFEGVEKLTPKAVAPPPSSAS